MQILYCIYIRELDTDMSEHLKHLEPVHSDTEGDSINILYERYEYFVIYV